MATQAQILASIKSRPEGATISELATEFSVRPFLLTAGLAGLRKKSLILKEGEIYRAADTVEVEKPVEPTPEKPRTEQPIGELAPEKPLTEKPVEELALPSDYSEFMKIGQSIGVTGEFLKSIADFVFRSDPYDIAAVHESLKSLHLRPDTVARWASMWGAATGKPMPKGIEATGAMAAPAPQRFSIIANRIVADPAGVSHLQALQELEVRLSGENKKSGGDDMIKLMISRQDKSDDRIELLLKELTDQRLNSLASNVQALDRKLDTVAGQKEAATKYGVLQSWGDGILAEVKGVRQDVKPLVQDAIAAQSQSPLRKRSAEEKQNFSTGLDKGIEKERKLRAMEDKLFFGKTRSPEDEAFLRQSSRTQKQTSAPPPPPELEQVFE